MSKVQTASVGKPKIVAVDGSDEGLNIICRHLQGVVDVVAVREWEKAWKIILSDANVIAVLIDQAVGGGAAGASAALENVRGARPKIRRVLITPAGELGGLLEGLHSGVIERVVYKPIDRRELVSSFVTAMPQVGKTG